MEITTLDVILLFIIIAGGIWGLATGAVKVVAPFTAILALVVLMHAYPKISAQFGKTPLIQFFLALLLGLTGLLIFGLVLRALQTAVHANGLAPVNRLIGLGLGLIAGTLITRALVWWLQTYGAPQAKSLLEQSVLAPAVLEFFQMVMAFIQRLFPWLKP
jgi:uncharacterized membrane protein required for colicin V production